MPQLLAIRIVDGPVVVLVYTLAGAAFIAAILLRPSGRWSRRRWARTVASCLVSGGAIGLLVMWWVADVDNAFGVELTPVTRLWVAVAFAGVAVGIGGLVRARPRRLILSVLAIVMVVACSAMAINIDFGEYQTVRTALGFGPYDPLTLPALDPAGAHPTISTWTAPRDLRAAGAIGTVAIPGLVSKFAARDAVIYLPPAALVPNPPLLPVLLVLSGQPGVPGAPLDGSHLREALDAYARAHQGLAPIVVSPDQLGQPDNNPMCVDGPLGNSATYLTVDVPNWIKLHLGVLTDPANWAIGGYSQGGTCAIQLGPAHPELFSGLIDASGQVAPSLGSVSTTVRVGFSGDEAAYRAAAPLAIFAAHAPMKGAVGIFGVGANDSAFHAGVVEIYNAATQAGMSTTFVETPGAAHDTKAWGNTFAVGLGVLAKSWGLDR